MLKHKSTIHNFQSSLIALAMTAAATAVAADPVATVTMTFDTPIFADSGSDAVHISFPKKNKKESTTAHVAAGRFQGTATNLVNVNPSVFFSGVNDVFMYCYDVYEGISDGRKVKYTIDFNGANDNTLNFLGAVNSVLSNPNQYDPYAWLRPATANQGAAIQIGIWESLYETTGNLDTASGWKLDKNTGGSFQAWGLETATLSAWSNFVGAIDSTNALDRKFTMVLKASGAQDMITGDPPISVPEPGSLALIGLALAGLAASRQLRRKT